ncbi:UDP-N-acetylglucosamine 4,6-dehydratase (inverting) [Pseudomonadota bacterium]
MVLRTYSARFEELDGKNILITGGTGSFGRSFVREVLRKSKPQRLIIFSRDELKQYEMQHDPDFMDEPSLRFFIGDVRDRERLRMAMRGVDYVVHAAALKHVTIAEYNPFECIRTNVYGAENVVSAALDGGVKKVVALSTDKAASPINLYGASKLASDKIFVAANNLTGGRSARFCAVRYGNVLGSRGSVVPYFKKLIEKNSDHLPITDPRMTRFWITMEKAVEFVVSCLNDMVGGEIFVPKIPSTKMTDLASVMAPNLEHRIIGIRPGEKLHEVMITEDDARNTVEFKDRFVIEPELTYWRKSKPLEEFGKPVSDGFSYTSDKNTDWLSDDELRELISNIPGSGL